VRIKSQTVANVTASPDTENRENPNQY